MTPKDEARLRRDREIERGRAVVAKNYRYGTLDRWIWAKKIDLFIDTKAREARAYIGSELVARCKHDRDYPTELFVAQVGLAIKSLSDFTGVAPRDPPPKRQRDDDGTVRRA